MKHTILIQNIKPEESNAIGLQIAKYVNTFGGLVSIQTDEKIFNPEVLKGINKPEKIERLVSAENYKIGFHTKVTITEDPR